MKRRLSLSAPLRTTALLTPALLALVAGCGPAPAPEGPPQPSKPEAPPKPGPRPALSLPARFQPTGRAAVHVGRVGDKSLYLVQGERWLVDKRGAVERERQPWLDKAGAGLPVGSIAPLAKGWVTWGARDVYTFDDLLGVPRHFATSEQQLTHVRTGPDVVMLFTNLGAAVLDPRSGAAKTGILPGFPTRDVLFADDNKRGLAETSVGGIGVTADGGQTWKPLRHKASSYLTRTLFTDGADVYLREVYGSRAAKVDVTTGNLGEWADRPAAGANSPPSPIESFILSNGNPIGRAVRMGLDAGKGTGVVAWSGKVARVDLATGVFTEVIEIDAAPGDCRGVHAGKEAYLICPGVGKGSPNSGSQLWRLQTDGKLAAAPVPGATFSGYGAPEALGSPAGGILVNQGCAGKYGVCVRQADGSFANIEANMIAYTGAVAPLADGRLVSAGTRRDGDKLLLEVVVSTARERKVLAEVPIAKDATISVTRPEEGEDGVLRFLGLERMKQEESMFVLEVEPGKKTIDRSPLPDLKGGSFSDGVIVGVPKTGPGLVVSHDHGGTFKPVNLPEGQAFSISGVNRLGTLSLNAVRVGWDPLPTPPAPVAADPAFTFKTSSFPTTRVAAALTCKSTGASKTGLAIPRYEYEVAATFDPKPAPKGTRRSTVSYSAGAAGASAQLLLEGKEPPQGGKFEPEKWILRWIDGRDTDTKTHSVSAKAPYPDQYPSFRGAWARDGRLFFALTVGGKSLVGRTKSTGFETAEVPPSLLPSANAPQSFSSDGSVIAYLAEEVLVVWKSGELPRPIASVNVKSSTLLGTPTKEGVPVLIDTEGTTYYRVFPLPTDKLSGAPADQWVSASWDGWTRTPSLFARAGQLTFCDAKPQGSSFRSTFNAPYINGRVSVDGGAEVSFAGVRYDIVTDGRALCVDALASSLNSPVPVTEKVAGSIKVIAGLDLLRLTGRGKKADITHAGRIDKVPLQAVTCEAKAAP